MSVGPGVGSVGIELYTTASAEDRWDQGIWDGTHWIAAAWQEIACQVIEAEYQTGAATEAGVLSVPDAGQLDLRTFDPARLLDPLATASPYFGSVRPGTPVRLVGRAPGDMTAWTGFLDEVSFDLAAYSGRLRAIDGIAYLSQAEIKEGTGISATTLRARVREIVAVAGMYYLIPVQGEVADIDPDPPVAAWDGKGRSAWEAIQDAALDALTYVWLGPTGMLRFTPWGSLPDATFAVGCDDGTGGDWLAGLATIETAVQAEAVRNSIRSWASANTFGAALTDLNSIQVYGERRLDVDRIVPNASTWAARILADRADSGLEVTLGELRPYTEAELALLLQGKLDGPQAMTVRDDDHGEVVEVTVAVIGGSVGITEEGWRFHLVTMIPRAEWAATEPPPVKPPEPPVQPYHTETRQYVATSDALLALTSGGAKYGAGAATTLPVGAWQGWTYRSLVQLPAIPWGGLRRIVSATLILKTSDAVRVGFGSSPTIELHRITGSWSAGSSSSPGSGNAVVWPGPAVASANVRANTSAAQNATVRVGVTSIILPWASSALGGSLQPQRGIAIYGGSGSTADTTEFWPVEKGGTSRPTLELVVEVFD